MTSKHVTKKQQFWPGSKVEKSFGNAFDWTATAKGIYSKAELAALEGNVRAKLKLEVKPTIPTYSKARHEKTMAQRTTP